MRSADRISSSLIEPYLSQQEWRRRRIHIVAVLLFVAVTFGSGAAQQTDRPITAAIIYLLGVTCVAALEGIRGGLAAAVTASLIYNVILNDPVMSFSLRTAEDYVPLLAFNLSAAASGLVAGRLKDRMLAAEQAFGRLQALLAASQKLQQAVEIADIPPVIDDFFGLPAERGSQLIIFSKGKAAPANAIPAAISSAQKLIEHGRDSLSEDNHDTFLVTNAPAPSVAVIPHVVSGNVPAQEDVKAFLRLLGIATERCLLLQEMSEAELLKRSEQFKTALLSSVSHDLRTPLSVISASASSLASFGHELSAETRADLLLMIQEQCDRLNRYTTNLLNLVRLRAGLDPGRFTECDALDVLGAAISRIRNSGASQEIKKSYSLRAAVIRADPVMLEQVFYNILENAVRYGPPEMPIHVTADASGDQLVIAIADEGAGIAEAEADKVFQQFYRGDAKSIQEGSGLGLSIVRGFTEAFGGAVHARRSGKGGALIEVRLPLVMEQE